jgi:hypothetical protein
LVSGGLQEEPSGSRAQQDSGKGPHFQKAVAGGKAFMGDQFGKNAVFRWTEQRTMYTHAEEHDQG